MKFRPVLALLVLVLIGAGCGAANPIRDEELSAPSTSSSAPGPDCDGYSSLEQYSEQMRCLRGESASEPGATSSSTSPPATTPPTQAVRPSPPPTPVTSAPLGTGRLSPTPPPATTAVTLPDDSFEVRFESASYLCQPEGFSSSNFDCVRYSGGPVPSFYSPTLYCSGRYATECSKQWYPDELDDYDQINMGGTTYLCKDAFGGEYGDKDCAPYRSGDPVRVSFLFALKCSPDPIYLQCNEDYYPSEMEGLEIVTIDYEKYVCKDTYQGKECHRWYGSGSPKSATYGMPDLYCNDSGVCAEDGYPSRW